MNILQQKITKYALEKSDQALEKAKWLTDKDYLTDAPAKYYDAIVCILLALAYNTEYISLSDRKFNEDELFFIWKSDKEKYVIGQDKQFIKWVKEYNKGKIEKGFLYKTYKYFYAKNLSSEVDVRFYVDKKDLLEDFKKAKMFFSLIKEHIYALS